MSIKRYIEKTIFKVLSNRYANAAGDNLPKRLSNIPNKQLSEGQKEDCRKIWDSLKRNLDWRYWILYNSHNAFNALMVPDDIFVRDIIRTLNPIRSVYALQTKSNYQFLFASVKKPKTVLSGINGLIYDLNNNPIDDLEISSLLSNYSQMHDKCSFILKPTGGYGGLGVKKVDIHNIQTEILISLLNATRRCFVLQEEVKQSPITSAFNLSSLNTFRLNTLNLNGKVTSTNILFRHGRNGAIVDNGGSGGICCGVLNDGHFTGLAFDSLLNQYVVSPTGGRYEDVYIPEVAKIVDLAIDAHRKYLPMMGHAAWDFGLDMNNEPVFIEVNLGWPGIVIEQLACKSPIYGERTKEVIDYVAKNKHKLKWTEFTGDWI